MSRGPHPDDARLFAPDKLPTLRRAAEEVCYLLGRGYSVPTAVAAAGGHHQLELRQRLALSRSCSSDAELASRAGRLRRAHDARGGVLRLDGFNVIVTLEVALGGGLVLRGREGALRDLAGLRGSYHLTEWTERAVDAVGEVLAAAGPARVEWLFDAPVSNSGRLRALVDARAAGWAFESHTALVPDPDPVLAQQSWVASSDGMILDRCGEWVSLTAEAAALGAPGAWLVDLFDA